MKCKIWLLTLITLVSLLATVGAANAALTLNTTATSVSGTLNLGAKSTALDNISNCSWYIWDETTAGLERNKTSTNRWISTTYTSADVQANNTFIDTNSVDDAPAYRIKVTCSNSTNATGVAATTETVTVTGWTVANSNPGANVFYVSVDDTAIYFSAAINSSNVTSCRVVFSDANNPGNRVYTLEDGGSGNASYTEQLAVPTGSYTFTGDCTDGTDVKSAAASNSFTHTSSEGQSGLGGFLYATGQAEVVSKGRELAVAEEPGILGMSWKWVLIVVGLLIGIFSGILLPLPIPKQFLMPVTAAGFAILGYIIGGLI